jgi:hypothetical protein
VDDGINKIGVKEAVQIAAEITRDLYSDYELRNLLLEEVEQEGDTWLVTMGFTRPFQGSTPIGALAVPQRAYKRIKVDAKSGEFLGMEDRQLTMSPQPGRPE